MGACLCPCVGVFVPLCNEGVFVPLCRCVCTLV